MLLVITRKGRYHGDSPICIVIAVHIVWLSARYVRWIRGHVFFCVLKHTSARSGGFPTAYTYSFAKPRSRGRLCRSIPPRRIATRHRVKLFVGAEDAGGRFGTPLEQFYRRHAPPALFLRQVTRES
jgi:hypothetical protein